MCVPYTFQCLLTTGVLVGLIVMADTIKPEAHATVYALQRKRIGVYLLTGDNRHTAHAIAGKVIITVVIVRESMVYYKYSDYYLS